MTLNSIKISHVKLIPLKFEEKFQKKSIRKAWRLAVRDAPVPLDVGQLLVSLESRLSKKALGDLWKEYAAVWRASVLSCTTPSQLAVFLADFSDCTTLSTVRTWSDDERPWADRMKYFIVSDDAGRLAAIKSKLLLVELHTKSEFMLRRFMSG